MSEQKLGYWVSKWLFGTLLALACHASWAALTEFDRCTEIPDRIVFTGGQRDGEAPLRHEYYGARREDLPGNPEAYAGHALSHVRNCTIKPVLGREQTMSFMLRSQGYFASGVVNHLAISLRARMLGFATGVHSGKERFQGRGIVIGSVLGGWPAADLCPGPFPLVQPETWGRLVGVTKLWGQSTEGQDHCGPSLTDGRWYRFELSADAEGLAYVVRDATGKVLRRHRFRDRLMGEPDRSEVAANTGYFVAVMCADADATCRKVAPWSLELKDFKLGWR